MKGFAFTIVAVVLSAGSITGNHWTLVHHKAHKAQATTFVGPRAAQYARWEQGSQLPPPALTIQATMSRSDCGGAAGCRAAGRPWGVYAADRDSLLFELGGEYDYAFLKGWQRAYLTKLMQPNRAAPWFTTSAVVTYTEDGLEADFNTGYADCAEGYTQTHGVIAGLAPAVTIGPAFCRFLRSHPRG